VAAEYDVWERKYHLALERMERDERAWREAEETLRRLVVRLAALSRGQHPEADDLLDRLAAHLRDGADPGTLESLVEALADIVSTLEPAPAPGVEPGNPPATPGVEPLRHVLLSVLSSPSLTAEAAALRAQLDAASGTDALMQAAEALAALVNRQRDALRADIASLQALVAEVSGRLGDMTRYLAAEADEAGASASDPFDASLRDEISRLNEEARTATSLDRLQQQVNERLALIDQHVRDFRAREDVRLAAYRERADRMRDRVEELESQATTLQDSLRREHELALTDPLTGLPNRLAWEQRMSQAQAAVGAGAQASVCAFDIDHFKSINDSYGHAAGDAVLRIVGQTLTRALGERAFVARYGGEEFVVLFPDLDAVAAMDAARMLCNGVENLAFHASGKPVTITMSGGVTGFLVSDTVATVFDRADRALYDAKRAGRNRCVAL
jgi:diguanylate cyclase